MTAAAAQVIDIDVPRRWFEIHASAPQLAVTLLAYGPDHRVDAAFDGDIDRDRPGNLRDVPARP